MEHALILLLMLLAAHAVADFPLQGEFLSKFKSPSAPDIAGESIWPWALSAHSAIHSGAVLLVTGSATLAVVEFILHWLIDLGKCRGLFGFHTDQALHIACKVSYVALIYWGFA